VNLVWGLGVAGLVSWLAYRVGALTRSGLLAATLTGGLIFGLGRLQAAALLLVFFISSSALSRFFGSRKASLNEKFSKGNRRDWAQVLANGGLGAALVALYALGSQPEWLWAAYAGAIAAVNADTWATELGVLNPGPPRLINNFQIAERGASGAISLGGSLAALAGAGLIGALASFLAPGAANWALPLLAATTLGGLSGSFFDSLLGATVQAIYWCPACQKETERSTRHTCDTATSPRRGWRWMDNDMVNFLASLAGAIISALGWIALTGWGF
jgi:uncharacterized protein (TIGR00297 family)